MLFKLALKNLYKNKGYFIAYILSVVTFFVIVYELSNAESQLREYFSSDISMSSMTIEVTFTYLKYFLYLIVICFSIYISHFFIKRRKGEIALLKTLGLGKKDIWTVFFIENGLIIAFSYILSIIFGILLAQVFCDISSDIVGLKLKNEQLISMSNVMDVSVIAFLVYFIMNITPLRTISKVNIVELFSTKTNTEIIVKKPWISLLLFCIMTILIVYQGVVLVPNKDRGFGPKEFFLFFGNAIFLSFFLYKGLATFFFIIHQSKNNGITSSIKLLSLNHLAANLSSVYKMMAFISIITAAVTIAILGSFGLINKLLDQTNLNDTRDMYYKLIAKDKTTLNNISPKVLRFDKQAEILPIYTYGDANIDKNKKGNIVPIKENVLILKNSDFNRYLKVNKLDNNNNNSNKIVVNEMANMNVQNKIYCKKISIRNKKICNFIQYNKIDKAKITTDKNLHRLVHVELEDDEKKVAMNRQLTFNYQLPNIFVLPDDNKVFSFLKENYLINGSIEIKRSTVFEYFNLIYKDNIPKNIDTLELDSQAAKIITSSITFGLFQVVFLFGSVVTIVALMMSIFFRALENLEKGIDEYVIAQKIGFSKFQTIVSLLVEAFISQISPFLLGALISAAMFRQIVIPRMPEKITLFEIFLEKANVTIFAILFIMMFTLMITLVAIVSKKIKVNSKV